MVRAMPSGKRKGVLARLPRASYNFVVDVREVAHVGHAVAQVPQHAHQDVEAAVNPRMPCMMR